MPQQADKVSIIQTMLRPKTKTNEALAGEGEKAPPPHCQRRREVVRIGLAS